MNCETTCDGYRKLGRDACQGCAGNNSKQNKGIKSELLTVLNPLGTCKHGLMRCTCGVCSKHPFSVAVKGGHVVGTGSNSPAYLTSLSVGY